MAPSAKGKEKVIYSKESAKRKRIIAEDNDGSGKKRNRAVLQFIEDAAYQVDEDESSDEDSIFDEDFEDEEFDDQVQAPFEPVKADPRTPKQERVSEEDFDKIMENRYKPGSGFVAYEEDKYETKNLVDETPYPPLATDAVIWKVKCTVGRERHSAFCLMQKYIDLKYLGTKLHTLSAFALDHVKGFIYIEADKQSYIYEACNGICSIYSTRATVVPKDEISLLFSVRSKGNGISEGMWARVKNGKYRGDLAQVVAVNDGRKKVTVKLIPRIDLRALAEKFGRGAKVDKNVIPAPRLISASELEEFRPLIQYRRDRDTNKVFEVLDGMMFKDGYLFKKVSADSLSLWGVTPTEDELLKFEPSKVDEGNDDEWLTQLYGARKKKSRPILIGKGSGKGEGSSSTTLERNFEVHDLVFFWRKDFGVIIGTEKDDTFKIIKDGSEVPLTVTVKQNELRSADFDKKLFTALDQHGNKISINDTVRVVDGPLKDREGVVKRIYRGIVFIYNEASEENNGYICVKTQTCEKLESSVGLFTEKGGGPGISSFGDHSSPKSPLSPQISQQEDRSNKFDNKDDDAVYSIGQSLRIRVGPLKGYLCRVLAIRRSDVTVKLDSKHKIITVKCEHLSEVRGRSAGISLGADSDPVKPFEPREQDGSGDWMAGSTNATEGGNWNSGGSATVRSSWGAFPTSNPSVQADSSKLSEEATDKDDSWTAKPTSAGGSSWGAAAATPAAGGSSWGAAAATPAAGGSSWGATAATPAAGGSSWSGAAAAQGTTSQPEANNWNTAKTAEQGNDGWGCVKKTDENTRPWGKAASDVGGQSGGWNKTTESTDGGSALNDTFGGTGNKADGGSSSWSKPGGGGSSSWNKPAGGFSSTERDLTAGDNTSGWGDKSTNKNEGEGGGGDVWNKKKSSEGVSSSVWGHVKGTETSNWNSQNDLSCKTDGNAGDWSSKIVHKEGSSSGWGQAKRLETSNSGGNQNSWGAQKSDNLQNSFGGGDDQSVPHDDKGRGGGQRGGRGGRWGSGRGRFGGNGMDSERDGGSWSGNKSNPVNQDSWGPKENNFGRSDGNNGGGWSSKKSAGGEGDAGAWGVSKSSEGGLSSGWGKDNTAGKSTATGNQDSWGNKSSVKPDNDIGGNEGGSNGGWNSKKPVDGRSSSGWGINKSDGTNDAGAHQDSWGSKSNVEGGSSSGWGQSKQGGTADIGGSEDTWGKKTNADWGKSSGWGKTATDAGGSKDNWGKKNDGDGGSSSGWGQSKWGGAADAGGSGETWGKKSTWNSDSDNNLGGNEEDTGRGGGNWRGGSGGRWSSDRGRFGGRSDSDRGDYGGGRGRSDRGGFGGRGGSERGGFGGRYGSDEGGGFRGRGRSDRGGFRGGRDGSDRGGFRGRGGFGDRGRGRSSQNDSGEDKPYSWNSTADKGASWSSGNGGGSWGEKQNDNNGKWQSGGSAGWNSSQGASVDGGNSQAGGWNRGSGSTLDSGADAKPSSWKNASEGNGAGWSSNTSGGSWNSGDKGKKVAQGSSSDWNQSKGPSKDGGDGGNTGATGGWKAANSSGEGTTSSTWGGQKADGEGGGSGSGSGAASWGKAPSGFWNQASGGSGKGGW